MQLSLSVRIAEGFLSKEKPLLPLDDVAAVASAAGYEAICLRASQVGVTSSPEAIAAAKATLDAAGLAVSMVTGNFDIVYNNEHGPSCLRRIKPFLALADQLDAAMIRVAMKQPEDIVWAQRAADEAAEWGLKLVHQCHTLSLFETVESIDSTLRQIDRPNFGLIYEPANLELCHQAYGQDTIERLAPWIFNVYLQNQRLTPEGAVTLDTWCRGPVSFDIIQVHDAGGIDFPAVLSGLRRVGYDGPITVHQSAPEGSQPADSARLTAELLKKWIK